MAVPTAIDVNGVKIDLANETLTDRSGAVVVLRAQSFAVLRYLVDNADRLVAKDELMAAVWPGLAVTDDSLVQCVHQIRRALGDEGHQVLKTVPKRGYRLVLPTDASPRAEAPPVTPVMAARGRLAQRIAIGMALVMVVAAAIWWQAVGSGPIAKTGLPAIAVLPFENIGGDASEAYFADGVTEDLITDLSKLSGVLVIARNSVQAYRGKPVDPSRVAEELGVSYLLEGSVRRQGDQVRINAQLIDAAAGSQLWGERYDGRMSDVFALQDKVIANIMSALTVNLAASDDRIGKDAETTDPQAYDALLLGLYRLHLDTREDTIKAIAAFERAVAIDRNYGRAYAGIAAAALRAVQSNWYSTTGPELDDLYARLGSNLADAMKRPTSLAYTVAAAVSLQNGRNEEALGFIDKARALAPNDPDTLVGKAAVLNAEGRAVEAEAELRRAMRLDPGFSPATLRTLSASFFAQGKYWEAIEAAGRIKAQGAETAGDYLTLVASLGQLGVSRGVDDAVDGYNRLALAAGRDPISAQEAEWFWHSDLSGYDRATVDRLVAGLRKAGVPEGAGTDVTPDRYRALVRRTDDGRYYIAGGIEVSALAAGTLFDRGVPFVDVRSPVGYASGHVPRAINLSLVYGLSKEALMKVAGPDDEVVFYCHSRYCEYSALAAAKAMAWGYKRVYHLTGGLPAWKDADCPVEMASSR